MLDQVSPLLININLALLAIVLLVFFGVAVFMVIILRNVNETVKSANDSAASVKRAAEKASTFMTAGGIYKALKGATKKKGDKDDK